MSALGASVRGGAVTFSVWAPRCERLVLTANLTAEPRPLVVASGRRRRLDSADPRFGGPGTGLALALYQVLLDEPTG